MSIRILVIAVLGLGLFAPRAFAQTPAHHPRGINAREARQTARIRNGVQNQELTKGELDRLRGDEAAIRAEERVYRRSGNGLSPAERRDLEKDLNRTSREIYRDKHNHRTPGQ
jgi:hypothetical protein